MYEIKVTYKINNEIKTENQLVGAPKTFPTEAERRRNAMADALRFATGVGEEEYYKWDDPEILEREIISIEIVR